MARKEADREDLMNEARAFVRRAMWRLADGTELFAGFREDGRFSVFLGQDPCYHFDTLGRLRRSYAGGFLYRTQGSRLARLSRVRTEKTTILRRRDLSASETTKFLQEMASDLGRIREELSSQSAQLLAEWSPSSPLAPDVIAACRTIAQRPELAPAIPTRPS